MTQTFLLRLQQRLGYASITHVQQMFKLKDIKLKNQKSIDSKRIEKTD